MSRELRVFVAALVFVLMVWFGVGALLPRAWPVETRTTLRASPAAVLPLLQSFAAWRQWSALGTTERPDTSISVEGEPGTVGHRIVWRSGPNEAAFVLTAVGPSGVEYDFLNRVGQGQTLARQEHGSIAVAAAGEQCSVLWRDEILAAALPERWFAWFGARQDAVRKFQDASLAGLRARLEGAPPAAK